MAFTWQMIALSALELEDGGAVRDACARGMDAVTRLGKREGVLPAAAAVQQARDGQVGEALAAIAGLDGDRFEDTNQAVWMAVLIADVHRLADDPTSAHVWLQLAMRRAAAVGLRPGGTSVTWERVARALQHPAR